MENLDIKVSEFLRNHLQKDLVNVEKREDEYVVVIPNETIDELMKEDLQFQLRKSVNKNDLLEKYSNLLYGLKYDDLIDYLDGFVYIDIESEIKRNIEKYITETDIKCKVIRLDENAIKNKIVEMVLEKAKTFTKNEIIEEIEYIENNYDLQEV